ncbi:phosphoglycerate dehydrogenase [Thioalkalivibrio sp. HK1]|uniref:phosphoglycerate dehydrogenase n=1 Tax=Thioalkalivibrio sp. HK1 TaxID=1469245 RepID=UPI0004719217|nr:phosphoglycerate dehydrogenase [Thioalkalivibrio sp. HK1]
MFHIQTLDSISATGLSLFPCERYLVGDDPERPDVILLRSRDLHRHAFPESVKAVARAGAGFNNIPVDSLTDRGIVVFNTPGANANAVKELTMAGLLISSRRLCDAWSFVQGIEDDDPAFTQAIEQGKKRFTGSEIAGRTLGVVGLGAIGVEVANAAISLGMRVLGFDPSMTVRRAWQLSSSVDQAASVEDIFAASDFVTLHVPLGEHTLSLADAPRIARMRKGTTLLNMSRSGIADDEAVLRALDEGRLANYVTDFPSPALRGHPRVIALPHIGASTVEAQENCATMVAKQTIDFLERGTIVNAVNFPEIRLADSEGKRIAIANANVPNMLGQISTAIADAGLNILDMLNRSRDRVAYTLTDVDGEVSPDLLKALRAIEGVLSVRAL